MPSTFWGVFFYGTQFLAMAVLMIEILYITFLKPSKFQVEMLLLLLSTLIMLIGYSVEIFATSAHEAVMGAAVAYIGKPFAMLMTLLFVTDYCGTPLSKKVSMPLSFFALVFPILIFTNGSGGASDPGHHLYYATASFDDTRTFSPLQVTRGPLYFLYMVYLIAVFTAILFYLLREMRRTHNAELRRRHFLVFMMVAITIIGYVVYLLGVTKGYDTTMTGASIGTILLTVVFFRYRLFDSMTLAKEQALQNAVNGLLVLNENERPVYSNAMIDKLVKEKIFTMAELAEMQDGISTAERCDRFFDVRVGCIENKGRFYGKTVELRDVTDKHTYSVRLEKDVEARTKDLLNMQRTVIASFAGIVEARDNSTGEHIRRMSRLVGILGNSMFENGDYPAILSQEYVERLVEVAPLHDLGKLSVPDAVLLKPGKLTDEEFEIIKTHSAAGARVIEECLGGVESSEFVSLAKEVAHYHHEKWNGKGYPEGLSGEEIPLAARIVAVADVYDAIRSERCYKKAMSPTEARTVIAEGRGNHFDPKVVDAFFRAIEEIERC